MKKYNQFFEKFKSEDMYISEPKKSKLGNTVFEIEIHNPSKNGKLINSVIGFLWENNLNFATSKENPNRHSVLI